MMVTKLQMHRATILLVSVVIAAVAITIRADQPPSPVWQIVVNNGFEIPDHAGRFFNSYNPPSVNAGGMVVFRARGTGRQLGPVSGIYLRDMGGVDTEISKVADRDTTVPAPNNTEYPIPGGGGITILSPFNEFPSFPRIAMASDTVATRGNHQPVWTYAIDVDPDTGEPITTRVGNTGVYVYLQDEHPLRNDLFTGASLLGAVPEFSHIFAVPGFSVPVEPETKFDVFPGAPAITDDDVIAFKGNYTVPDTESIESGAANGKTGVYYRRIYKEGNGGLEPIQLVANSDTRIPNPADCASDTTFGSTAPPSAAGDHMVFVGLDNEEEPSCGGIYLAAFSKSPEQLTTLVGLETKVPGHRNESFTRIGEALTYDGRFVGFWGAWGTETKTVRLYCPAEGNKSRRDFCNHLGDFGPDPNDGEIRGDPNSICNDTTDDTDLCYQEKDVPVAQGIFVYDTEAKSRRLQLRLLAQTAPYGQFDDFVYWNYSGAPPGHGASGGDAEPPRFRSSAFLAITRRAGGTYRTAFLARKGELASGTNLYLDPIDGIQLAEVRGASTPRLATLIQTGMDGTLLDPEAVWDDDDVPYTPLVPLPITSLALERDAFRGNWLAITASMGIEETGWAGIYIKRIP